MRCPTVTDPEVVGKIIHLRQHYHFGPLKITMYLQRYHDAGDQRVRCVEDPPNGSV